MVEAGPTIDYEKVILEVVLDKLELTKDLEDGMITVHEDDWAILVSCGRKVAEVAETAQNVCNKSG